MARDKVAYLAMAGLAMVATQAAASGWVATPATSAQGAKLIYSEDKGHAYIFACSPSHVLVTNVGVTDLLDIRTNTKIGDNPGSVMTPGASNMTIYTGTGEPKFQTAEVVPNPTKGWDMTIRLAKGDKLLKSLTKATMMSLFTTGYTMAVTLDDQDRATLRNFINQCRG